jgi:hypothetical protein
VKARRGLDEDVQEDEDERNNEDGAEAEHQPFVEDKPAGLLALEIGRGKWVRGGGGRHITLCWSS